MSECTCGHLDDEPGGDPAFPGSTSCAITGCGCIAFEAAEEAPIRASATDTGIDEDDE